MPKSRSRVAILALIMVALGLAATLCARSFAAGEHPATPVAPTPAPTKDGLTIISVLLIGADSLSAPQPRLESFTIIKYQTEVAVYHEFMFSPDTVISSTDGTGSSRTLQSFYADDARNQRQPLLIQAALRQVSSELGGFYAEVDFDRQKVLETLGKLGASECLGQAQTGEELLRQYDALPPEAGLERLHFQGSLVQCLFDAAKKQNWSFPQLIESLGTRFYPTRDHAVITAEAAPPLAQSEFAVIYSPLNLSIKPTPRP